MMINQQTHDKDLQLASVLIAAWTLADNELREDIQEVIRKHSRRSPGFVHQLNKVLEISEQEKSTSDTAQVNNILTHIFKDLRRD